MNNFAVSSDGIATALQDSASALMEGGNNLEQAVALVAAANKVVQDPNSVGSALRTISLRLRGTSVEVLEQMGEETDGVIESTSKLQEKIKALTGVDIVDMNGAYKDTYTILKEIGEVWKDLDPMDQAAALELMAGKNRANTLAAILNNTNDLKGAYESALDAEGSALKENEAYLDSIQGRIDLFNNSLQTMWMNFLNTDVIKFIVNVGTGLINLVDNIGLIETALMGVVAYLTIIKKQDITKLSPFGAGKGENNKINLLKGTELDREIELFNSKLSEGAEAFGKYKLQAKETGNGMDILADKVEQGVIQTKNGKVASEDYTIALQSQSSAATNAARAEKLKSVAIGLSVIAISGIISAIQSYADSVKTLDERYEELQSNLSEVESDISSLESELETIQERIDSLSNKNLTITEAEELRKLKEQSAELQRQKELRESVLDVYKKQNEITSFEMFNQMLKKTAAMQEKTAEKGKALAKVFGTILDTALVVGGAAVTTLSGGLATAVGTAMVGAGLSGTATSLTGAAADAWSGTSKSVDNLTEWYDSYVDAIASKEQEVTEAENRYFSTLADSDYEKWQKKLDEVNTLKEDLYNNLEKMQGYIDGLEYNEQTKNVIDEFNKLMTHISVTNMDGNIDTQISSIEALTSEFYELSRGVDEHGNNIALSAEEYARYNSIVDQVLSYQSGLTKGFDENGNAILRAADSTYMYNQLLATSIDLLRQQRQEVAKDEVDDESIVESYNAIVKNYSKEKKKLTYGETPDALTVSAMKNPHGFAGGANWGTDDVAEEISYVIGVDYNLAFGNPLNYVRDNIGLIQKNRDEITSQLISTMQQMGLDDTTIQNYINQVNVWLDGMVDKVTQLTNKTKAELRDKLYIVPKASDLYYNLDGDAIAFINKYIEAYVDGIEDIEKIDIKKIRDDILELTNAIGENAEAGELINKLFALNPSKMSVKGYKEAVDRILDELVNSEIITQEQRQQIYGQFLPSDEELNEMKEKVQAKLTENSKGLIEYLTLPELQIAYKFLLEEADGSLTFEELKQKIAEYSDEINGPIIETYSALKQQVTEYNQLLSQSSEIVANNTKVTQEYKDSLIALGISEDELATCFDRNNNLVVTNASKLQELINKAKNNTSQNIKLAKSQSRLQYYELFKKMQGYINAEGQIVSGKKEEIAALYAEMSAIEKVISKYETLEAMLLGTTSAYEKFQDAQTADSETNYIGQVEEMIFTLGEAFNTAELGTESAQAAIAGLVPESVYKDLDTVDEKMSAIYEYFKTGKLSQYFDITFDDDGNIEGVEMKLGNLRKFIEDGLIDDGANVFDGTDWQHFEFSDDFLAELDALPEGADKLQYFADKMDVTKDVALAFIKALEDHDIEWLNGNYYTMFEDLLPDTLESDIFGAMEGITELNKKLAAGEISAEEYAEQLKILTTKLVEAKEASRSNMFGEDGVNEKTQTEIAEMDISEVDNYFDANQKVINATNQLEEATTQYENAVKAVTKAKQEGREVTEEEKNAVIEAENAVNEATKAYDDAIKKRNEFAEPTEAEIQIVIDDIESEIAQIGDELDDELSKYYEQDADGYWVVKVGMESELQKDEKYNEIIHYVNLLNSKTMLTAQLDGEDVEVTLNTINDTLTNIQKILETVFKVKVDTDGAVTKVNTFKELWDNIESKTVTLWTKIFGSKETDGDNNEGDGDSNFNGTAHASGTARASGNWGLPSNEHDSLVGELGPELVVDPQSGRYYTVGDNGAEMVDLKRGSIIFNHKQTEGLLKNGHITSRGKAYAEGNAHLTIWPQGSSKTEWEGTGYSSWDDTTYDATETLSDALSDAADSVNEFEETIDWIEIRMEEFDERIGKLNAEIENLTTYAAKNAKIDEIIVENQKKYADSLAGARYYEEYAQKYLAGMNDDLVAAAKNGSIAITEFTKEQDEATVEAINNYRDYAQKAADLYQQAEEILTDIRDSVIQKIDNIQTYGEAKTSIEDLQTDKLQSRVDLDETRGIITSPEYYTAMMENSGKKIEYWTPLLSDMQKEFDNAVKSGKIQVGSTEWYEQIAKMYDVQSQIDSATIELEEFQNAINDIYWDNFDQLIDRIEYVKEDTQSLIDLMDSADMVITPETDDGWSADQVEWTKEGMATLGLYAQQMETAEFEAKQYAKAIDDLTAEYEAGHYSENEYLEKLNELKKGQYDNIEAYHDAQDAIKDLNKTRIDAIKEGIEKEIDAYEELINKKKEELSVEKDLYDFQKGVADQQKNIADIQRKLAALSSDNSASAVAKRKQLEAELAEANAELEETYYDRSIENQQNALDKELEDFKEEKDAEIEKWEEYLTNVEQVVADSLNIVQANATEIGNTLTEKAQEYNLTVSDAVLTPWKDGALAVSEYQTAFDTAASSTTTKLEEMKNKWQEVIDKMAEAGQIDVNNINAENANYAAAKKTPEPKPSESKPNNNTNKDKAIVVGGKINASGAKIYSNINGTGYSQYFANDPIYTVLSEQGEWLKVRHHKSSSGVTGWFKKGQVKAYAKGTLGVDKDQWALIDELGEELVMRADDSGKLSFMTKGSTVIPHDITENLMELGQLDPTDILNRNRPQITPSKSVINNNMEIHVDASVSELIHVEHLDGNNLDEITKVVDKAWDKKMQGLNSAIKKFSR